MSFVQNLIIIFFTFKGLFASVIAIDFGTANTLVYQKSQGIVLDEPSVLAKYFIRSANTSFTVNKPSIIKCVPSGSTPVERRAIQDAAESAGANKVFLIEEPMAAAIGVGLPVTEPEGSMIVDIGGGTTEVAIIPLAGIVYSRYVRVGGDIMDEAIKLYIREKHKLLIGEITAEKIKKNVGSASLPVEINKEGMIIKGMDLVSGMPKEMLLSEYQVEESLIEPVHPIISAITTALESTPPELSSDIVDREIILSGRGGILRNWSKVISETTKQFLLQMIHFVVLP